MFNIDQRENVFHFGPVLEIYYTVLYYLGVVYFCTHILRCLVCIFVSCLVCIVVVVLCAFLSSYVYLLYYVCIAVFTLDARTAGYKGRGSTVVKVLCYKSGHWFDPS